ncbi:hydroxymethylglutaryl-CoA lyase [Planococcus sp. APC 3906]|uniref:hydroxymethylglutaryl-CoA lyase n=1 Tax=Planococcus sp. APC 3906 TaxID=3035194 RepID=UPI0025B4C5AD|nr:hydroxymethylglutaryl-CoA lyase [Planococcus sp. APC 3906]MDN3448654.1 hydroxymethylglutaryl-CoA lyase [Planococcus sp. APC 3906]
MHFPQRVQINEVVLRDGLQLEAKIASLEEKKALFNGLVQAGVETIEFGSFVHPKAVPQMANSGELYDQIAGDSAHPVLIALIPNLKGAELASSKGVERVNFVFSASNTHNLQNVNKTTEQSLEELEAIHTFCKTNGIIMNVSIATSFGCPFEGDVPSRRIHELVRKLIDLKIDIVTLADTTGMANPRQVSDLLESLKKVHPEQKFNLHFHNTRGMGLANILAALEAGADSFDTSLGGLGGCPFAPGATGNVCTEDTVHMLHSMGIETGISLEGLIETSRMLEKLVGHNTPSYILKAGPSDKKYPVPNN